MHYQCLYDIMFMHVPICLFVPFMYTQQKDERRHYDETDDDETDDDETDDDDDDQTKELHIIDVSITSCVMCMNYNVCIFFFYFSLISQF